MTMQRWDPFRSLRRLEERGNQSWPWAEQEESWTAPLDVIESPEKITVHASVPGVNPDKLQVTIENGLLNIRGENEQAREEKEGEYLLRERQYGVVYRSVRLPDSVNADRAETKYENGVLTVTFPKAETKMAKRLKINVGEAKGSPEQMDGRGEGERRSETERKAGPRAAGVQTGGDALYASPPLGW